MSSITFGSVGVIVNVCLLAKSIVDALDQSRGSSAEYKGLVSELRSLERSLLEAELFVKSLDNVPNPVSVSLRDEILNVVNKCRKTLEAFQLSLKEYDKSLAEDKSASNVYRIGMKLKWQLSQKDNITKFRGEVSSHCNSINMMMLTAQVAVSLKGLEIQTMSSNAAEGSFAEQNATLQKIRNEIQSVHQLSSSMNLMIRPFLPKI